MKKKIIFIVGPTASGKSEVAAILAKRMRAEIISCDSMQVYRGMDIITAKPSLRLRKKTTHHLIGMVSALKEYDVSQYHRDARRKIEQIVRKGKIPIFSGGTGLYMSIMIDGIFKMKPPAKGIRAALYQVAKDKGNAVLYRRLKDVDPEAAARIHPHDIRRVVRALEVFEATGKPISILQKQREGLDGKYDIRIFCLNPDRDELYRRIGERIERMFARGLLKEVRQLLKRKLSKTSGFAIGLKELKGYFAGEYSLAQTKELMKRNTRLYAKRQITWFRKDKRIHWLSVAAKESAASVANRIWETIK